jgi:hypothetical protein
MASEAGPAHVATVSFLASRATPAGGFWVALAGGVALARAAQRKGARQGFGASLAAMLETVAIMGPARFGVPLTQAISAPMLGRLEARSAGFVPQVFACAAVRLLHNTLATAFFIWVITGGLDAYAGTYDALADRFGVELGTSGALLLTAAGLLAWAAFASTVQVLVYRRGLRRWKEGAAQSAVGGRRSAGSGPQPARRFDPRAVALAAAVAFVLLLASTSWWLLGGVAAWLALAWAFSSADREPVPTGLLLAALLAGGALVFSLGGGLGVDVALRRASRAALLVLVATWLRAAAGAEGLREVSRRVLGRFSRIPSLREAAQVLDAIGSEGRLAAAGRALVQSLRGVRRRPVALLDAVLGWVAAESARFEPEPPRSRPALAVRGLDVALIALTVVPGAALLV